MHENISISGDDGTILIHVTSYERGRATDEDDANWLRSEVTVTVGAFSGTFRCVLMTFDLVGFAAELKGALAASSGTAHFRSSEHDLDLEVVLKPRGTATIKGALTPQESLQASMSFTIDSDQSFLAKTLRELEAALRRFPVRSMGGRVAGSIGSAENE